MYVIIGMTTMPQYCYIFFTLVASKFQNPTYCNRTIILDSYTYIIKMHNYNVRQAITTYVFNISSYLQLASTHELVVFQDYSG